MVHDFSKLIYPQIKRESTKQVELFYDNFIGEKRDVLPIITVRFGELKLQHF
jgi:hypothetical protein